ncbi:MAG: hypothetical protein Q8P41_05805 [Pseudomonadota bacterium]|nr:hypothetical protein [Pseudomonadota bacterium]
MIALLLTLVACGADAPLDQPNGPPPPPPMYGIAEADVAKYGGVASEIHGPTRSFVLTGEGKRVIATLGETATLRLGGMPSQVQDLQPGTLLYVEGRRDGDTLFVVRASDTSEAAPVVPVAPALGAPDGAGPDGAAPDGAGPGTVAPDGAAPGTVAPDGAAPVGAPVVP